MTATFKCYLCSQSDRVSLTSAQLTNHFTKAHGFPSKKFLQASIRVDGTLRRIILNEMASCPIGGCNAGPQKFTQQSLIAHVQKSTHKPSVVFSQAIHDGYYFWWLIKLSNDMTEEDQISTAFTQPEKRKAALARIFNIPGTILDPLVGAESEIQFDNEENDSYKLESDATQAAVKTTTVETVNEWTVDDHSHWTQIGDPGSPLSSHDATHSSDTHRLPIALLTNVPNLNCPPSLLKHNFAIIHLPEFQGNPIVPVCILCRTIINSPDYTALRKHQCGIHKPGISNVAPTGHDFTFLDGIPSGNEMEPPILSGVALLDPIDILPTETDEGIDETSPRQSILSSWQGVRTYFSSSKDAFVKVTFVRPTGVIPPISFLPTKNGYGCPMTDCSHAYEESERAQRHVSEHVGKLTVRDAGEYQEALPTPCTMQTLGNLHGRPSYFRVCMPQATLPAPDGILGEAEFIAQSFDRFNHYDASIVLQGLPFKTPFFKRFDYQSIYPADQTNYTNFVTSRINHVSASYNCKQKQLHHLLAIVALVYTRTGGFYLNQGSHIIRRHLGNKLSSDQLGSAISHPFSNLQETGSILRYSSFFASLVAYVMDVVVDPAIDPDLVLAPKHKMAAQALHASMRSVLSQHTLINALPCVRSLGSDAVYADPPEYFTRANLKGVILETSLRLQDLYHELAFAIVKYPRFIPPEENNFRFPVHRFLALQAWNTDDNVFYDIAPLHNVMVQLQWSMRMIVYQEFRRLTKDKPDEDPIPILTLIKDECASKDASTPFGHLQDQISYASVLTKQYTVVPNATFDCATQTACLNGVPVSRVCAREMFHKIKVKLYHVLDTKIYQNRRRDIFVASTNPQHSFDRGGVINDTPSSPHFGYSYLTTNNCFTKHKDGLRNLFVYDPKFRMQFLQPFLIDSKPVWNLSAIDQWVGDVDHFKYLLVALVYWLSGMPPRGVEFTGTLIYNITNAQRNIYCAQGDLVLEYTYSKSEASTGHSRPVMRQPPHDLQQALEEYIVIVKDVYDSFVAILHGEDTDASPEYRALLWTYYGRQMDTKYLSQALRTISLEHLGHPIGISSWRQYLIQFAHNILPRAVIHLPLTVTALSSQASHGPTADRVNYDRQTDTTFAQVNSSQFLEYQCISLAWGEAWGFPHPTRKSGVAIPGEVTSIHQETLYITTELSHQINLNLQPMIEASVARAVAETKAAGVVNSPSSCRFTLLDVPVTLKALSLVNKLHSSNSGFRSAEQAMCVQYAMDHGASPLFVVHPTGHGKSSIYLAPMLEERGSKTTLLVVPLLTIAQLAQAVAATHGFNAINLRKVSSQQNRELSTFDLVIMTYDLFVQNPTVVTWLHEMVIEGRLSRIVMDEAHTLVTEKHYSASFTHICSTLAAVTVPHIFLSSTMPESCCIKILNGFQNYQTVFLSRLPGDRVNLAYSVDRTLRATSDSIDEFALRVRTELYPKLMEDLHDRILIFSRTSAWAEHIAKALECRVYMRHKDLESQQEQLDAWLSSTKPGIKQVTEFFNPHKYPSDLTFQRILVSTSSIFLELDHPNVRYAWFYGDPHDAITFILAASRAGRNGKTAFVRLFPSPSCDHTGDSVLQDLKSTALCRRTPFSLLLDGRRITCAALPHAIPCDNCTNQHPSVGSIPSPPTGNNKRGRTHVPEDPLPSSKRVHKNTIQ